MSVFLSIDQSANLEDGLYTGEEICAMLGESDGVMAAGIDHIGVEMELDPEVLSSITDDVVSSSRAAQDREEEEEEEDNAEQENLAPLASELAFNRMRSDPLLSSAVAESRADVTATRGFVRSRTGPLHQVRLGQPFNPRLRSIPAKLQFVKRQLFNKAAFRLRSVASKTNIIPVNPSSQKQLTKRLEEFDCNNNIINKNNNHKKEDDLTMVTSHDSIPSSSSTVVSSSTLATRSSDMMCCAAPSSITASTCDFSLAPNHDAVFESYLESNPWDAAKRGDYATLSYMCAHDDPDVWTQEDEHGRVPLYYACVNYSGREVVVSFGKYGLESVRLLVEAWPRDRDLPSALSERLRVRDGSIHEDVLEVLSRSGLRGANGVFLGKSETRVEGAENVIPVSFLEDLGDEGYVEDY